MVGIPARRRIGLLLPSSNTTQEIEYWRIMPADVSLHVARLPLRNVEPNATLSIVNDIETESRKLADADVEAIVLAATAPSSRLGPDYDRELAERITRASGKPATTAATAQIEAMTALGIDRIVIAAPWTDEVNRIAVSYLESSGKIVLDHKALGLVANLDIGQLDAETAMELGRLVDRPDAQAIMLACGNWATLEIVDRLEQTIGKPVLTTNQVSLWAVLRLAGYRRPIRGWGRLLREPR